jgi:hypothetical protein
MKSVDELKKEYSDIDEETFTKVNMICSQDLYKDFLHTEAISKLISKLYIVKVSQIENGVKYILDNTPYEKWKYVPEAIEAMKEYYLSMHDNGLMRYFMEDMKHLEKQALKDTFNNISVAAGIEWLPKEWSNKE